MKTCIWKVIILWKDGSDNMVIEHWTCSSLPTKRKKNWPRIRHKGLDRKSWQTSDGHRPTDPTALPSWASFCKLLSLSLSHAPSEPQDGGAVLHPPSLCSISLPIPGLACLIICLPCANREDTPNSTNWDKRPFPPVIPNLESLQPGFCPMQTC